MSTYIVEAVLASRDYEFNGKQFIAYLLKVEGPNGSQEVELSQIPSTPAPQPREPIDGEVVRAKDPKWPDKLKRAKGPKFAEGVLDGPRGVDREPRIIRQHSQEMALLHVAAMERRAAAKGEALGLDLDVAKLKAIIDFYQRDAENAKPLGDQ